MADPAHRTDRPGGGKIYTHPISGEVFDSVTSVLDDWDKSALKEWAAMLAAETALDIVPLLLSAGLLEDCGNTYNRCYTKHGREATCERCPCGSCSRCMHKRMARRHAAESGRRADEGTECHAAIDHWVVTGGDRVQLRLEVVPYFSTFLQFAQDYGLQPNTPGGQTGSWEQVECTLLNRGHKYAGTSDAAIWIKRGTPKADALLDGLRLDEALVRVDYKTREKPDERLYNDMPLQGVAYECCDTVLLPDGSEHPAPKTHARAVLQLRPANQYTFAPMVSGDPEFEAFLGLLAAYRWRISRGGKKAFDPAIVFAPPDPMGGLGVKAAFPPAPEPAKRAPAKKAPAKSALAKTDPFDVARSGGARAWPAGQPEVSALNDYIPF